MADRTHEASPTLRICELRHQDPSEEKNKEHPDADKTKNGSASTANALRWVKDYFNVCMHACSLARIPKHENIDAEDNDWTFGIFFLSSFFVFRHQNLSCVRDVKIRRSEWEFLNIYIHARCR